MTTEAGRVMLERFRVPEWAMFRSLVSGDIAAIEAEARAALLAELEVGVEGLECPQGDDPHGYYWGVFERNGWDAATTAVLDLIRKAGA